MKESKSKKTRLGTEIETHMYHEEKVSREGRREGRFDNEIAKTLTNITR